jgi:hypothetical protein
MQSERGASVGLTPVQLHSTPKGRVQAERRPTQLPRRGTVAKGMIKAP